MKILEKGVKATKVRAEIFVGGSLAKGTLAKSDEYDVDIFVRFDKNYKDLSLELEKILKTVKVKAMRWHGSRDYFRVPRGNLTFEVIPVKKIKRMNEMDNITDLSYFHVNYIKKNLSSAKRKEVVLAKKFCKAIGVYGAESYIGGFSGYGIECLIIYYGGFEKMIRALEKIKGQEIIDIKKLYKKKSDVLIELNESKLQGPIILVDPTWKERNVFAGLTWESFEKFRLRAREFLKNPSKEFFSVGEINVSELEKLAKKRRGEFVHVVLKTNRQEGDIAGTKMKKFSRFLCGNLEKYFLIVEKEFVYSNGQEADLYLVVKSRGKVLRRGPPLKMKKACYIFKKRNEKVVSQNGRLFAKIKVDFNAKEFLKRINKKVMREMGISGMKII
mgnify:CR=1 FL=1